MDLFKKMLQRSTYLKTIMEDHDGVDGKDVMKIIYREHKITYKEIHALLCCDITNVNETNILKYWNFLYQYDIDIKDQWKELVAMKIIYDKLDYKLNIDNETTATNEFVHDTCINVDFKYRCTSNITKYCHRIDCR